MEVCWRSLRVWLGTDPQWGTPDILFRRQVAKLRKNIENFVLLPMSQLDQCPRIKRQSITNEVDAVLNAVSFLGSDEEKVQGLLQAVYELDSKIRLKLIAADNAIQLMQTVLVNSRHPDLLLTKSTILGSMISSNIRNSEISALFDDQSREDEGSRRFRIEELERLREKREEMLKKETKSFKNESLYPGTSHYGEEVISLIRKFLEDEKVSHEHLGGQRVYLTTEGAKEVRVMETFDKFETHSLFYEMEDYGGKCIREHECQPGPNKIEEIRKELKYLKYYRKCTSGVDPTLVVVMRNYREFRLKVREENEQLYEKLPVSYKNFLKSRVCLDLLEKDFEGDYILTSKIHDCEDENCERCTFLGYLSSSKWRELNNEAKKKAKKFQIVLEDSDPLPQELKLANELCDVLAEEFSKEDNLFKNILLEFQTLLDTNVSSATPEQDKTCSTNNKKFKDILSHYESSKPDCDRALTLADKQFRSMRRRFYVDLREAEDDEDEVVNEEETEAFYSNEDNVEELELLFEDLCAAYGRKERLLKSLLVSEEDWEQQDEILEKMNKKLRVLKHSHLMYGKCLKQICDMLSKLSLVFPDILMPDSDGEMDSEEESTGNYSDSENEISCNENSDTDRENEQESTKNEGEDATAGVDEEGLTTVTFYDWVKKTGVDGNENFEFDEDEMIDFFFFDQKKTSGVRGKQFFYPTLLKKRITVGQFLAEFESQCSLAKKHLILGEHQNYVRSQELRKGCIPRNIMRMNFDFSTNIESRDAECITDNQWRKLRQWSLENYLIDIPWQDLKSNLTNDEDTFVEDEEKLNKLLAELADGKTNAVKLAQNLESLIDADSNDGCNVGEEQNCENFEVRVLKSKEEADEELLKKQKLVEHSLWNKVSKILKTNNTGSENCDSQTSKNHDACDIAINDSENGETTADDEEFKEAEQEDEFNEIDENSLTGNELLQYKIKKRDAIMKKMLEKNPHQLNLVNPNKILYKNGSYYNTVEYNAHCFSSDTKHDAHLHYLNQDEVITFFKKFAHIKGIQCWSDRPTNQYLNVTTLVNNKKMVQRHALIYGANLNHSASGKGKGKVDLIGAVASRTYKGRIVKTLGAKSTLLARVIPELNTHHKFPRSASRRSRLLSRHYFGRKRSASVSTRPKKKQWKTLKNIKVTQCHQFYINFSDNPKQFGAYARSRSCNVCYFCTKDPPEVLMCCNSYCGEWAYDGYESVSQFDYFLEGS